MGFEILGDIFGNKDVILSNHYVTAASAINYGALLKNTAGSQTVQVAATGTLSTIAVFGIAKKASTSSDTFTVMPVEKVGPGTLLYAEIEEIANSSALPAPSTTSSTQIIDATWVGAGSDDVLIGTRYEVLTMASGNQTAGYQFTATDYVVTTGAITFSTVGATGFASGDTVKMISFGITAATKEYIIGEDLLDVNGEADAIELNIAAGGDWCRVTDVTGDGKRLIVACTSTHGNIQNQIAIG